MQKTCKEIPAPFDKLRDLSRDDKVKKNIHTTINLTTYREANIRSFPMTITMIFAFNLYCRT